MSGITSGKRKSLTLEDKYKGINENIRNPTRSNGSLSAKFNCGKSTISEILGKQRTKILEHFTNGEMHRSLKCDDDHAILIFIKRRQK